MKKEYSMEIVETAENLYVYKQKTYEEVSEITGVPAVTIQRWSNQYEWRKRRIEYINQKVGRRRELYLLKDNLIKNAKDNSDDQAIYKLAALQRMIDAEEKGDQADGKDARIDRPQLFLDFMRDLVSFLKERDPESMAAIEKNFDEFVGFAKTKYAN